MVCSLTYERPRSLQNEWPSMLFAMLQRNLIASLGIWGQYDEGIVGARAGDVV